ncbi:MAG: hypothetical protein AMDU5_GPLC00004G0341 [Thermoplasmatales archaeon Gpl]|nr:MAG: hypothetical protein AMDU5_GPLC00004G0341 [Thermoplasmatales archaeon Gpl]
MNYIDKNVILCYPNKNDLNRDKAAKLWAISELKMISEITLLELRSVLSRKTNLSEAEIEVYVEYLPDIGLQIVESDLNRVFNRASEMVFKIKMKTLGTLHISACLEINARNLVTLDY